MREPMMNTCFSGFPEEELPSGVDFSQGKVRDIFDLHDELIISTSDRISAFDRILGCVPFKGEILNRLSVFWFEKTEDIVANHLEATLSPRSMLVRKCKVVPIDTATAARRAPRPAYSVLENRNFKRKFGKELRSWHEALMSYIKGEDEVQRRRDAPRTEAGS